MKYRDIPQFLRSGNYVIDVSWGHLEEWIATQEKDCLDFQLDPDFQRYHVWSAAQRTEYVEYILKGGHSSMDLYFNCANYTSFGGESPMVLVDGKQRLESVRRWLRNEIPAFGVHHSDMVGRIGLGGPRFIVHVNQLETREEVLRWYLQLNTGGVVHTESELAKVRHMLHQEEHKHARRCPGCGRRIPTKGYIFVEHSTPQRRPCEWSSRLCTEPVK